MASLLDKKVAEVRKRFWKQAHKANFAGESPDSIGSTLGDIMHDVLDEAVPDDPSDLQALLTDILSARFDFYVGPSGGNDYTSGQDLFKDVIEDIVLKLALARDPMIALLMPRYTKFEATPVST